MLPHSHIQVFNLSSGAPLSQALAGRVIGCAPAHVLSPPAPSPATVMMGPRTHQREPELQQNTHGARAMQIGFHTWGWVQGRGSGNSPGRQKMPGDPAGGMCRGVQNWHLHTSVFWGTRWPHTQHTLFPSLYSSFLFSAPVWHQFQGRP